MTAYQSRFGLFNWGFMYHITHQELSFFSGSYLGSNDQQEITDRRLALNGDGALVLTARIATQGQQFTQSEFQDPRLEILFQFRYLKWPSIDLLGKDKT